MITQVQSRFTGTYSFSIGTYTLHITIPQHNESDGSFCFPTLCELDEDLCTCAAVTRKNGGQFKDTIGWIGQVAFEQLLQRPAIFLKN